MVVVDDAHLNDAESLRALLFAARRLHASPALGVAMTPDAAGRLWEHMGGSPLYAHAVLRELPDDESWQHEPRPLPVPASYAQLVRQDLDRCPGDIVTLVEAAAVLGVRAPLHAVLELSGLDDALATLDAAIGGGLVRLDDRAAGAFVEFSHPLVRAAIYDAMPKARRSSLNTRAAQISTDALLADLEAHAHGEMSRGAWSSAVSSLIAASRLSPVPADRERLALEAIEAMLYSGDGAAARRLAEQTGFAEGPRRDGVLAYLAMFAGHLESAQGLLTRAWERRELVDDPGLSATIAQRSAFLATSRLRGARRSSGRRGRPRWRRTTPPPACSSRRRSRSASASPARELRPMRRSTAGSTIPRRRRTRPASSCSP